MSDIQFAAMTLGWGDAAGEQLEPFLADVKQAGYDGVTSFADVTWARYIEEPDDLARLLDRYGLAIASMDVKVHRDWDEYRKVCQFMASFDCKHLVCLGGVGTTVENYVELAEVLNPIGDIALEYGIRAVYHNGRTRETFEEMRIVLDHVDPDKVFAMCDLGHATRDFVEFPYEERAIRFLETFWDRIDFIEFKDFNNETELNTPIGEGLCDWDRVFSFLKKKRYTGWITVEQNGNLGDSKGRTALECATISRDYIRQGMGI